MRQTFSPMYQSLDCQSRWLLEEHGCRVKVRHPPRPRSHVFANHVVGFTADVLARIIQNTAFNPALTLPLLLFAHYTGKGRELSTGHETALKRLKLLLYIGIARLVNGFLSRRAQNNWTSSKYNWGKEIAVVTGGSDGIGKEISLLLAKKGVTVAILDIQPLAFESSEYATKQSDL